MKNRLIKTFIMILTIFIVFFIGNNKVKADDTCYWVSPLTYIGSNGKQAIINAQFEYETKNGPSHFGPDVQDRNIPVTSILFKYGKYGHAGFAVEGLSHIPMGLSLNKQGGYNIYLDGTNYFYNFSFDKKDCSSQKYIRLTIDTTDAANAGTSGFYIQSATENEYISYLKKSSITHTFYAYTTDNESENITDSTYNNQHYESFYDYVKAVKGIYLINTNMKESYPNERYNELIKGLEELAGVKSEDVAKTLNTLNIDTSDKNIITYTKAYYDATKASWAKYYRSGLSETTSFKRWFRRVSRYILEENPKLFKEYFIYINNGNAKNDNNYNQVISVLDGMIGVEENNDKSSCLETNPCAVLCHAGKDAKSFTCSGTAFDQCSAASEDYKKCSAAYKACAGVKNQASAYDACMKVNMGDDLYTKYTDDKQVVSDAVDQERKDLFNQIAEALSRVSEPTLNIDFEGYKVKCEDVVIFHDLYIILRIAAPILVIILGSLDYAKATLASDIDKMEKEKKKFPKRLILVVLFMIVPVIIDIILSLFSNSTNMDVNSNIMYCIIRGS